jgi:hypothetical protein
MLSDFDRRIAHLVGAIHPQRESFPDEKIGDNLYAFFVGVGDTLR